MNNNSANQPDSGDRFPLPSAARSITQTTMLAALTAIPVLSAVSEIIMGRLQFVNETRLNTWLNELAVDLEKVAQKQIIDVEELFNNPKFVEVVMRTMKSVAITTDTEKLRLLRNVIRNTAQTSEMEHDLRLILMSYIDDLTVSHVNLLKFLDAPKDYYERHQMPWPDQSMGGLNSIIKPAFTQWTDDFISQLMKDLYAKGLTTTESTGTTMTGAGLSAGRSKDFGTRLLDLIEDETHNS